MPLVLMAFGAFLLSALARKPFLLSASLLCLILNLIPVAQLYFPADSLQEKSHADSNELSLLQMNLRPYQNKNYDQAISIAKMRDADIFAVIELTRDWTERLQKSLGSKYPYTFAEEGYGGIMIMSKYELLKPTVKYTGDLKRPRIQTAIKKNGKKISIILAHTVTPKRDLAFRNVELKQLAREAKMAERPLILLGDLNCSPFSVYFKRLKEEGCLVDSENGHGFQPTWPANYLALIPIDHVLYSKGVDCSKRVTGPTLGSDHLPVYVKLIISKSDGDLSSLGSQKK